MDPDGNSLNNLNKDKVPCGIGDCKLLIDRKHLARHRSIHFEEPPVSCTECDAKFNNRELLTRHFDQHHLKITKLCEICGRGFPNSSSLKRHKTSYPLQCQHCCSTYRVQGRFEEHLKKIHPNTLVQALNVMDPPGDRNQASTSGAPAMTRNPLGIIITKRKSCTDPVETSSKRSHQSNDDDDDKREVVLASQYPVMVEKKTVQFEVENDDDDDENSFLPLTQLPEINDQETNDNKSDEGSNDQGDDGGDNETYPLSQARNAAANVVSMSGAICQGSLGFGVSPIENYGNVQRVILTTPDAIPLKEFDPLFLLKLWGLVKHDSFYLNFSQHQSEDTLLVLPEILDYLCGKLWLTNNAQLYNFLRKNPQQCTGLFLISVLVVDYCLQAEMKELIDLYMEINHLAPDFQLIVDKTVQYRYQRSRRVENVDKFTSDETPKDLMDLLDYNFIKFCSSEEGQVITKFECSLLSQVKKSLMDTLFQDLSTNNGTMLDPAFELLERAQVWSRIAETVVNLPNSTPATSVFESLVLEDLEERHKFTRHYMTINCGDEEQPVHFHECVISKLGAPSDQPPVVISATKEDVKTLTNLLYSKYNGLAVIPRITLEVYKMAMLLNITDPWKLLYQNESLDEIIRLGSKKDFLKIIILDRHDQAVQKVAQAFEQFMPEMDRLTAFNGLGAEDLKYFFQRESLRLSALEVYTIAVCWAFHKAGKAFTDIVIARYDTEVKRHFDLIQCIVKIETLDVILLCKNGLVPLAEIKKARKKNMLLIEG